MTGIDLVYDAVAAGFRTSRAVAGATGISLRAVSAYLTVLRTRGEIHLTGIARRPSTPGWRQHARRKCQLVPRGRGGHGSNTYTV